MFEIVGKSSGNCLDVRSANYKNGTPVQSWPCNGTNAQKWIYTTERQLRPVGDQKYCLDIKGGEAGMGKEIHLWDCDGGSSEKWRYKNNGQFLSKHSEYSYAIDNNFGGIETQAHTWEKEPNNTNQIFDLVPVNATIKWDQW